MSQRLRQGQSRREPVLFGDAAQKEILARAGVEDAKIIVFAISDFSAVSRSLKAARELSPNVEILVRTHKFREIEDLRKAGANQVVAEEFESAIEIFTRVLAAYHIPRNVVRAETRVLRGEAYRMLRSAPLGQASEAVLEALEAGTTDIYRIAREGRADGRTLTELDLRRLTGTETTATDATAAEAAALAKGGQCNGDGEEHTDGSRDNKRADLYRPRTHHGSLAVAVMRELGSS